VRLLLAVLTASVAHAQTPDRTDRFLYLPPAWADRVVYYHSFDGAPDKPDLDDLSAKLTAAPTTTVPGFAGRACAEGLGPANKKAYEITSDGLSPHRPLTLMCWLRLDAAPTEITWYNLLRLWQGDTYITHFIAGKGEWCALRGETPIYQVVNFPGIPLYHSQWGEKPAWLPGEWHHVAMTVANGSNVRFYRDGQMTENILIKTRPFKENEVRTASLGEGGFPMTVDEVIVTDRALTAPEIADYVRDTQRLHEIGYPAMGQGE